MSKLYLKAKNFRCNEEQLEEYINYWVFYKGYFDFYIEMRLGVFKWGEGIRDRRPIGTL